MEGLNVNKVAEEIYYEMNPNSKIDVPSHIYQLVGQWFYEWSGQVTYDQTSYIGFKDWIKINKI